MKIAYIMSHREQNGVTASGTAQIRHLLARGHELHLVHRPGAWIGEQTFDGAIYRHSVEMGKKLPDLRALAPVRAALEAAGVEVAYSQGTQANVVGVLWRAQGLCPMVAKAAARIWHLHWRFHDAVIAPSQYTADWFLEKRLVLPGRIHVVPNFVRAEDVVRRSPETRANARAQMGVDGDAFVLGIIGSLGDRKNQKAILPILAGLRAHNVEALVKIIGRNDTGYGAELLAEANADGLGDAIELMGHRDDARQILPGFDALVCNSRDEQGPVVVIEALAAGVPAVSTPVGMVPTLIEPGRNGAVLTLDAPDDAIAYLARLATTAGASDEQGRAARQTFETRLAPDRIMDDLVAVLRNVARGKS